MLKQIRSTIPQMHVTVNGTRLPDDAYKDILEAVIESSLHLPDACTIRVHDHEFKWLDSNHWKEGNQIKIEAGQGQDPLITVFEGEVTTLEMDLAAMGVAMLTVRCMDKAHRLHRGKNRKTFQKMKDSDIVKEIARKNGMRISGGVKAMAGSGGDHKDVGKVDETKTVHDWTIQNNQTDWEFLQFLAQRNGHRVYLQEKDILCFRKIEDKQKPGYELEWGKELRSFRIRVNSSNQVSKVIVRSWDPKTKAAIVGQAVKAKGGPEIQQRTDGGVTAQQAFGAAEMVVVDRPVRTREEADKMAQSVCDDIGASFIEADGLCYNMPHLRPGDRVTLKNIGNRFNGTYILTTTTHTFSAAEGFSTQFVISGKEPATLMSVLGGGGGGGAAKTPSKGSPNAGNIVIGLVTDIQDPMNLGRVKVKFPALSDDLQTDWIRIATPMAGAARGFMFLPEVNDEVLVAFENGDAHQGYVIGCLWNGKDAPPMMTDYAVEGGQVRRRRLKTRYGHTMEFDDNGMIIFRTAKGQVLEMEDGRGMRLSTATGQQIYLTNQGGVVMTTKGGKMIHATDPGGGVQLYDEIGNMVDLDTKSGTLNLHGVSNVNLTSDGMLSIKSNAPLSVTAPMVNINSGGGGQKGNKKDNEDALKGKGDMKVKLPGVDN